MGKSLPHRFAVLVVTHDFLCVGQPLKEVGISIGDDYLRVLASRYEILRPSERGAERVAIRASMTANDDIARPVYQGIEQQQFCLCKDIDVHFC